MGVTGGRTVSEPLDSTETLDIDASNWVTSRAKLPQPMDGLRAANIDDRVLIFGGYYYEGDFSNAFYDDILEYVHNEDSIQAIGNMIQARASHAVSVVPV